MIFPLTPRDPTAVPAARAERRAQVTSGGVTRPAPDRRGPHTDASQPTAEAPYFPVQVGIENKDGSVLVVFDSATQVTKLMLSAEQAIDASYLLLKHARELLKPSGIDELRGALSHPSAQDDSA